MHIEKELAIKFRNDWQRASISLIYTYGILNNAYETFFKQHDLTSQQYNALRILREHYPEPISTSVLRGHMLDKMSDTSRLVNRLQIKRLVNVNRNLTDKRLVNILISEKGLELLSEIDPELRELDALMKGLTDEEVRQLSDLLIKVRASINSVDERRAAR